MTPTTLRKVLVMDALSCAVVFAGCVLFAGTASQFLGLPEALVVAGGWICFAAGLLFAMLTASGRPSRSLLALGVFGNALWILASLVVAAAFAGQMTGIALAIVVGQAAAVTALTWLEAVGVLSLRQEPAAA